MKLLPLVWSIRVALYYQRGRNFRIETESEFLSWHAQTDNPNRA